MNSTVAIDARHMRRCLELAARSLENGDDPFESVLVDADGRVLVEAMNREGGQLLSPFAWDGP